MSDTTIRTIHPGQNVITVNAMGVEAERKAASGVVAGQDFDVVWVVTLTEWASAEADGREPYSVPWPADDVRLAP